MSKYIQKILAKEMNRKEFLSYLGMFLLTLFGVSSLIKNISNLNPGSKKTIASTKATVKTGFGSSAYGV